MINNKRFYIFPPNVIAHCSPPLLIHYAHVIDFLIKQKKNSILIEYSVLKQQKRKKKYMRKNVLGKEIEWK